MRGGRRTTSFTRERARMAGIRSGLARRAKRATGGQADRELDGCWPSAQPPPATGFDLAQNIPTGALRGGLDPGEIRRMRDCAPSSRSFPPFSWLRVVVDVYARRTRGAR